MSLPFLFFSRVVARIIDKDRSLAMKQYMRSFVEESVPELIVTLISTAQLNESLICA